MLSSSNVLEKTPVQNFYTGQSILITGGSGFVGKVLIEKLLRSCPDISSIYVIIRTKKGQNPHQRLKDLFDSSLFDRLKKEVPDFRQKVWSIPGDISLPGLGISESDRQTIRDNVSIIFNVAANVKFEAKLEDAIVVNVQSTKEIMELSGTIKNLQALIHVSTLYSNCTQQEIEEKFYPPPVTADNALQLAQILGSERLENITKNLLGDHPNTYTFTKNIAEELVQQYGKQNNLPVGIFRPVIVTSSSREPECGWVDNFNGSTSVFARGAAGIIRVVNADENATVELVPVDLTVNALLTTAWDVANDKSRRLNDDPPVYNYHSTWKRAFTWREYMALAHKYARELPASTSLWYFTLKIIKSMYMYYFLFFLSQVIPAMIMDAGRYLTGKKTKYVKMYKKVHETGMAIRYFVMNSWKIKNDNIRRIWNKLTPEDREIFFFSMENFDWDNFVKNSFYGYRRHLFKEDLSTLPTARKRMSRIYIAHSLIKLMLLVIYLWTFHCFARFVLYILYVIFNTY